jgi:hypothetical protein
MRDRSLDALFCQATAGDRISQKRPAASEIGYESGPPVSPGYTAHTSRFSGKIKRVQIDLADDASDADHYIDHDERLRIMMARQ